MSALFETYGVDKRDPFPFYSWINTPIPMTAVDPEETMAAYPKCRGCDSRFPGELVGCDCEEGRHQLCAACLRDLCGGPVLVLGAEPPVRSMFCPDAALLARELMEEVA